MFQIDPFVKSKAGKLEKICFGGFYIAKRLVIILETANDLKIYRTYKKADFCKLIGEGLVVVSGTFHDNTGVIFQRLDMVNQCTNAIGTM